MTSSSTFRDARGAFAVGVVFLFLALATPPSRGQFPPPTSQPNAAPPTKQPGEFQPGVTIDWAEHAVRVRGRIAQSSGPLEFLACFAGKDHESAVRMLAEAEHVYMALGLCGNTPGAPAQWDESAHRYTTPTGDLVDVSLEWTTADGKALRATGFDWLIDVATEQRPIPRPWVFTGSIRPESGGLAAGHSGAGVAIVDMPDSLLALSRSHVSSDADLWAVADPEQVPAPGTEVVVVLRPATALPLDVSIDFRGDLTVNGRAATVADVVDLVSLSLKLDQSTSVVIKCDGAMRADRETLVEALRAGGIDISRCRVEFPAASSDSVPDSVMPTDKQPE